MEYTGLEGRMRSITLALSGVTGTSHNAELTVAVSDGDVIVDEVTGNYVAEEVTTVTIKAKLVQKKDPYYTLNKGTNTIRTYLEGWLVDPVNYDGAIPNYLNCRLLQNNLWVEGKFTFIDAIPTNVNEQFKVYLATGQKIKGYFEVSEQGL